MNAENIRLTEFPAPVGYGATRMGKVNHIRGRQQNKSLCGRLLAAEAIETASALCNTCARVSVRNARRESAQEALRRGFLQGCPACNVGIGEECRGPDVDEEERLLGWRPVHVERVFATARAIGK